METKEKTLLFTDRNGQQALQGEIENVRERANTLIKTFEQAQPWQRITTPELWGKLVSNPVKMYDNALIENSQIKAEGLTPDPAAIANLFNLDRDGYIKKAKPVVNFQPYAKFLLFQDGAFELNESVIVMEFERFNVYLENERQEAVLNHWKNLCDLLNEHLTMGHLGPVVLSQIAKDLGFRYVPDQVKIYIDEQKVVSEILKIKSK